MSKKVLILSGSFRKGGNSDTLCDRFAEGARDAGNEVEKIFINDRNIGYCRGCGVCNRTHRCVQKDDMEEILNKMVAADVIVMATPVYFYTMNGQMKTLIDRCCARYTEISGKEFYLLLTAAEEEREKMLRTADTFQGFFDCLEEPHLRATVFGTGVWHAGEIAGHPALREAYEAGKGI